MVGVWGIVGSEGGRLWMDGLGWVEDGWACTGAGPGAGNWLRFKDT